MNHLWVQNKGRATSEAVELLVIPRYKELKVYQQWIKVPAIAPGKYAKVDFWLSSTGWYNFEANTMRVQMRNREGRIISDTTHKVPVKVNR